MAEQMRDAAETQRREMEKGKGPPQKDGAATGEMRRELEELRAQMQKMGQQMQELRAQLQKSREGEPRKE